MNNTGCLSINDLYNFCCLKTQIYRSNFENHCRIIKNNIIEYINGCYETKMVDNAINGYNYSILYEGEIPYIIIKELKEELCDYFNNFKIKVNKIESGLFDKILNKHDIYQIIIIWEKESIDSNNILETINDNDTNISDDNEEIKLFINDTNNFFNNNSEDEYDDNIIHINSEDFENIL